MLSFDLFARNASVLRKNNEFLGNVGADLTGRHLNVATGRDEVEAAGDGKEADSDDDDDDDDNEQAGSNAPRQAEGAKGTETAGGGGGAAGDVGGTDGAGGASGGDEGAVNGGTNGVVKEMERHKLVRSFFRGLLKEWEMDLNARPDHVKRTVQGKLETKTQKQAKDYMRPLFRLCKQKVGVLMGTRFFCADSFACCR